MWVRKGSSGGILVKENRESCWIEWVGKENKMGEGEVGVWSSQ